MKPYIIKCSNTLGANEVAINFGYSVFAIIFFFFQSKKSGISTKENNSKNFYFNVFYWSF